MTKEEVSIIGRSVKDMYTENEEEANRFKDVLIRWQSKPQQPKSPDLVRIKGTKENSENKN